MSLQLREVDPLIWRACAGLSVKIPPVGSRVFYFPQGHAEQAASEPDFSAVPLSKPYLFSHVIFTKFLADPQTDEVFVKIGLDPRPAGTTTTTATKSLPTEIPVTSAFAKVLTQSDANNGGGFSVPRFCAEAIFPHLDLTADIPVQNIVIKDLVGKEWGFRHIYRGTPRRHLLTTGWSKFVNEKKLVAGDSVVFMKNEDDEIFVGIRRRLCNKVVLINVGNAADQGGFVRNGRGRVKAEKVVEAVEAAERGDRVYEVDYYPGRGTPEVVVMEEEVLRALRRVGYGVLGMRVKMPVEAEDGKRMTLFSGNVKGVVWPTEGPWAYSPWRMLQVQWEDVEFMKNVGPVSPWQVDVDLLPGALESAAYLDAKRPRTSDTLLGAGYGSAPVGDFTPSSTFSQGGSVDRLGNSVFADLSPSHYNNACASSLVGIQGARQDPNTAFGLCNLDNTNVEGSSTSQSSSPPSNSASFLQLLTRDHSVSNINNAVVNRGKAPFSLFGQIIDTKQVTRTDSVADTNVNNQRKSEGEGSAESSGYSSSGSE